MGRACPARALHLPARLTGVRQPAIQLDTSFLIRALVPDSDSDRLLRSWLRQGRHLAMSSLAWTELLCGPMDAAARALAERIVTERLAYGERESVVAAELYNETGRRRGSMIDCMIAATARLRGAPLATLDLDDFRRFETHGLRLMPLEPDEPDAEPR